MSEKEPAKRSKFQVLVDQLKAEALKEQRERERKLFLRDLAKSDSGRSRRSKFKLRIASARLLRDSTQIVVAKERAEFLGVVNVLSIRDGVGIFTPHKFRVKAKAAQYKRFGGARNPLGSWTRTTTEYNFFVYKNTQGNWRVYDRISGEFLTEDPDQHAAIRNAVSVLSFESKNLAQVLAHKPDPESLPEISFAEAVQIIDHGVQEKKIRKKVRKIESEARIQKLNAASDRYTVRE